MEWFAELCADFHEISFGIELVDFTVFDEGIGVENASEFLARKALSLRRRSILRGLFSEGRSKSNVGKECEKTSKKSAFRHLCMTS